MSRFAVVVLLGMTLGLCQAGWLWLAAQEASPERSSPEKPTASNVSSEEGSASRRLREGTQLRDQLGRFKLQGDRATFAPEGGGPGFIVLESLALERIGRVLRESAEPVAWSVDGLVTEYQGANYLLISRAVVRRQSNSSPPGR